MGGKQRWMARSGGVHDVCELRDVPLKKGKVPLIGVNNGKEVPHGLMCNRLLKDDLRAKTAIVRRVVRTA